MIRLRSTLNAAEAIEQMAFGNLHDERYKGHGHNPVAFISLLREVGKIPRDRCSSHTAMLVSTVVTVERHDSESALGLSVKHRG